MVNADRKLRERVKELRCLYDLSRIALETDTDISALLHKTLPLIARAMQFPDLAEVKITAGSTNYATKGFDKCEHHIGARMGISKNNYGILKVGYRPSVATKGSKNVFLVEERKLVRMVARELSLSIKRAKAEENNRILEKQLQHSERLAFVGELSAGIAHELNEPLGRILGFAQLVKKSARLSDQQDTDLDKIIKASLYTREIIKKLMIFSRQMPQQISLVNLNTVVTNTLYFIDVRFQNREVKIVEKLDARLPSIQADTVQMSQVLVNLITNAIHAMPQGGRITIGTKRGKNSVSLIVNDTGMGMSLDVKRKIFEPFFTTKPIGQGTGLGLSVVLGIVEEHKGRISVSSTPGKGSKFEIILPLKQKGK